MRRKKILLHNPSFKDKKTSTFNQLVLSNNEMNYTNLNINSKRNIISIQNLYRNILNFALYIKKT